MSDSLSPVARLVKSPCAWLAVAFVVQLAINVVLITGWVLPQQAAASRPSAPVDRGLPIGAEAPTFTLSTVDGELFRLDDLEGRRTLVAFSAVDCPYCQEMYPVLRAFQEERGESSLALLSFGSPEENARLAETHGFATVAQLDDATARAYEIPGTPFFYVVENGRVIHRGFASGERDLEHLWDGPPASFAAVP